MTSWPARGPLPQRRGLDPGAGQLPPELRQLRRQRQYLPPCAAGACCKRPPAHRPKQYGAVDNLSYAYQGNRLQAVDDAVSGNQLPQPATYHGAPTSLAGDFQEAGRAAQSGISL
ncbi:MAG: hypothetical protein WKG07_08035 [Hymenobacter sp.]